MKKIIGFICLLLLVGCTKHITYTSVDECLVNKINASELQPMGISIIRDCILVVETYDNYTLSWWYDLNGTFIEVINDSMVSIPPKKC